MSEKNDPRQPPAPAQGEPVCPDCGGELHRVKYDPRTTLNRDQFDSQKAGDYWCESCRGSRAQKNDYRYFWKHELTARQPPAPAQGEDDWRDMPYPSHGYKDGEVVTLSSERRYRADGDIAEGHAMECSASRQAVRDKGPYPPTPQPPAAGGGREEEWRRELYERAVGMEDEARRADEWMLEHDKDYPRAREAGLLADNPPTAPLAVVREYIESKLLPIAKDTTRELLDLVLWKLSTLSRARCVEGHTYLYTEHNDPRLGVRFNVDGEVSYIKPGTRVTVVIEEGRDA